jgi:hypothetical protein
LPHDRLAAAHGLPLHPAGRLRLVVDRALLERWDDLRRALGIVVAPLRTQDTIGRIFNVVGSGDWSITDLMTLASRLAAVNVVGLTVPARQIRDQPLNSRGFVGLNGNGGLALATFAVEYQVVPDGDPNAAPQEAPADLTVVGPGLYQMDGGWQVRDMFSDRRDWVLVTPQDADIGRLPSPSFPRGSADFRYVVVGVPGSGVPDDGVLTVVARWFADLHARGIVPLVAVAVEDNPDGWVLVPSSHVTTRGSVMVALSEQDAADMMFNVVGDEDLGPTS